MEKIDIEFIKDMQEYVKLKYDIHLVGQQSYLSESYFGSPTHSKEAILDIVFGCDVFKYFYNIGLEDYGINISFEEFKEQIFVKQYNKDTRYYHNSFWWRNRDKKSTKYQKLENHNKKELTLEEINKREWRKQLKDKEYRKKGWHYGCRGYYNRIKRTRMERDIRRADHKEYGIAV